MKFFVTGHNGYIGTHLVPLLMSKGYHVTGCDINIFEGCNWEPLQKPHLELIKDIRNITIEDLEGYDCVIHLAALSNDPMGNIDPDLTYSINRDGSIRLAELSKKAGVSRFLFSSSCSIYGKGINMDLNENDPTNPISAYAESKISSEKAISELASLNFSPVFLRNATAYGHSPMFRNDLAINNLLSCALVNGNILVKSDGTPWRPFIHCKDIARAFILIAESDQQLIHNQIINVGANSENYQVKTIADYVQKLIPESEILITGKNGYDPRDYRVNFDRFSNLFPNFRFEFDIKSGMTALLNKLIENKFNKANFDSPQFIRLKKLEERLHIIN